MYQYGESYISRNHPLPQEKGIIRLLSVCRTASLGSHFLKCDHCNYLGKAYNSCRNRHCPRCQHKDQLQWMDDRVKELLPVGYYHLVFTIPCELNPICLTNKKVMYDILFKAASQTVLELSRDTKHLGAETGLFTVLHTWGQNMMEHPHLHCIMPSGGLSFDKQHWVYIQGKADFFIHHKIVAAKFRGKYLDLLKKAYLGGMLFFKGNLLPVSDKKSFLAFISNLYRKNWVVNIQPPFGNTRQVLEYLSRYVFRIAISDRRILEVKNGKVYFSWKNYRTGLFREMNLDIDEFIRRFLLHVLPKGFFKVRYYGIFSSRHRKENILLSNRLLEQDKLTRSREDIEDGLSVWVKQNTIWDEIMQAISAYRKPNCPVCKKGMLRFAGLAPDDLNGSG
jgi:hypothetical protein